MGVVVLKSPNLHLENPVSHPLVRPLPPPDSALRRRWAWAMRALRGDPSGARQWARIWNNPSKAHLAEGLVKAGIPIPSALSTLPSWLDENNHPLQWRQFDATLHAWIRALVVHQTGPESLAVLAQKLVEADQGSSLLDFMWEQGYPANHRSGAGRGVLQGFCTLLQLRVTSTSQQDRSVSLENVESLLKKWMAAGGRWDWEALLAMPADLPRAWPRRVLERWEAWGLPAPTPRQARWVVNYWLTEVSSGHQACRRQSFGRPLVPDIEALEWITAHWKPDWSVQEASRQRVDGSWIPGGSAYRQALASHEFLNPRYEAPRDHGAWFQMWESLGVPLVDPLAAEGSLLHWCAAQASRQAIPLDLIERLMAADPHGLTRKNATDQTPPMLATQQALSIEMTNDASARETFAYWTALFLDQAVPPLSGDSNHQESAPDRF